MPKILFSADGKSVRLKLVSRYVVEKLAQNGRSAIRYTVGDDTTVSLFINQWVSVAGQIVAIAVEETSVYKLMDTVCAANKLYAACKEAGVQSDYELQLKVAGMIY